MTVIPSRLKPLLGRLGLLEGVGGVLARGGVGSLVVMVAGVGVGFLTQLLLARLLGVSAYGLFVFVYTWVHLAGGVCRLGVDMSALRFIAVYRETAQWGRLVGFLHWGRGLTWGTSLFVSALFIWIGSQSRDAGPVWYLGAMALPLFVAVLVEGGFLQGLKRPVQAQLGARLALPLLVMMMIGGLALIVDSPLEAIHGMGVTAAALTGTLLLVAALVRRALPGETVGCTVEREEAEWWQVSLAMLFITAVNLVQTQTDIVMLGLLRDTDLSGIYSAASKVAEFVAFGLTAANAAAGPLIAGFHARGDREAIQRLLRLIAWGVVAFVIPAAGVLALLGEWVLSLFGEGFDAGYRALLILMGGQVFNSLCGSVGLVLMMTGRQKVVAGFLGGSALLNIVLNALLIPPFGLEGAAIATATTLVLWNLGLLLVVVRRLGFNPTLLPIPVREVGR